MSKDLSTESDQRQFWQMAIDAWQASGLSVRQFCKQEGLSEPSFYAWCKRLTPYLLKTHPTLKNGLK